MPSPPFVCIAQKGNAMPEQALQVAFEIKTACDEISRRQLAAAGHYYVYAGAAGPGD